MHLQILQNNVVLGKQVSKLSKNLRVNDVSKSDREFQEWRKLLSSVNALDRIYIEAALSFYVIHTILTNE